jgi:diguanylate cyclase (GGDEF)-like protein
VLFTPDEELEFLKSNLLPFVNIDFNPIQERLVSFFQKETGIKSPGIIALEIRNLLIGVLVYERPSTLLQQEILIIFSRQATLTIENAKLFARVEEMAIKDTLTGLYNRRYFQQILDYEMNRSKRYRQPVSLIFLDVDYFKNINDTHGHAAGDRFLKQISNKFSSLFRTTDITARYAGDEFVAILPATDREGSIILAQRVLEALNSHQIVIQGTAQPISVSIGVATFENPEEGLGSSSLIGRADKAMYEAKIQGRNRVKHFSDLPESNLLDY